MASCLCTFSAVVRGATAADFFLGGARLLFTTFGIVSAGRGGCALGLQRDGATGTAAGWMKACCVGLGRGYGNRAAHVRGAEVYGERLVDLELGGAGWAGEEVGVKHFCWWRWEGGMWLPRRRWCVLPFALIVGVVCEGVVSEVEVVRNGVAGKGCFLETPLRPFQTRQLGQ